MAQSAQVLQAPPVRMRSERQRLWRTFTRNRTAILGLVMVIMVFLAAIFADDWFIAIPQGRDPEPLLAIHDPYDQDARNRLAPPSREHFMGLDNYGRDIWARVVYGARVALMVGIGSVLIGGVLGTIGGVVAGYLGGVIENAVMRVVDVLMAFPSLIMGMMVLAVLGAGLDKMILAIGLVLSPTFARVAHSATLTVKENDYIDAARSIGVSKFNILRRHILVNIVSELVVLGSIWTATAIRVEANLSFIGLGVSPPTAAWGSMIRDGTPHLLHAPWVSIFPGLAILVTVLGFNLLGDGLRDVLDPRLQQ